MAALRIYRGPRLAVGGKLGAAALGRAQRRLGLVLIEKALGARLVVGARQRAGKFLERLLLDILGKIVHLPGFAHERMGAILVAGGKQRAGERELALAGNRLLAAEKGADCRRVALLVVEQLLGAAAHQGLVRPVRPLAQERIDLLEAHVLGREPDRGPLHQRAGGGIAHLAREVERLGCVAVAQ